MLNKYEKRSAPFKLSSIQIDPGGRFLVAKLTIDEKYFFMRNIYDPNNCHDQNNSIETLISQQLISNIGTQSMQELFFCDRGIRRTVNSNDLVKCTARNELGSYDVHIYDVTSVMVR